MGDPNYCLHFAFGVEIDRIYNIFVYKYYCPEVGGRKLFLGITLPKAFVM